MNSTDSPITPAREKQTLPGDSPNADGEFIGASPEMVAHLAELEEKVRRLQRLVCHLLAANERMRQQLGAHRTEAAAMGVS